MSVQPIGARCACRESSTTHYVWDPEIEYPIATKCQKCAEEMRTMGWMVKRAEPTPKEEP